jgi:PTH1 family peptidyl-tRNA hydrolase
MTSGEPHLAIRLVAGLGNPGSAYAHTRHNVGFMVLDHVLALLDARLSRRDHGAHWGTGVIASRAVAFMKPWRFMNRSGEPVDELLQHLEVSIQELLVIHDDMDLELGRIQIKQKGGHGGHRGLRSIIEVLGGGEFTRVRVGIGRPAAASDAVTHVLEPFRADERNAMTQMLDEARDAVITVLRDGPRHAMNRFNSKRSAVST